MNKRSFLRLLSASAAAGGRRLLAAAAAAVSSKMTNWSGNLTYSTDKVLEPKNMEQVRTMVKGQSHLRVLGTRHCFNTIADSNQCLISMKDAEESVTIDAGARTVTCNAGITYGRLAPLLDQKGFMLHNLASLPHISVAGSCSTGTHGSGERNGNLSTAVSALEIVKADGEVVHLSRAKDLDTFRGAVVSLGALGVITKVTLHLQPAVRMRQYVYENLPLDQMRDHFDAIQASGYSVSLFTDWQKHRINEVWIKGDVESNFHGPAEFHGARLAARNLHPIAELGAENCTEQMGVPGPWYERLPHFRMGFTPSAGKELQSEYFVPRRNAVEAILAIERLRDQISPHLMISEIRTIAEDDLWLSPAYKRASVALHFTWKQDWPAVKQVLPRIESELGPFGVRPHWGKLFTVTPKALSAAYERMPEFVKLCGSLDPSGKFRNEFVNRNIFGM
jgi:alditol oxidase